MSRFAEVLCFPVALCDVMRQRLEAVVIMEVQRCIRYFNMYLSYGLSLKALMPFAQLHLSHLMNASREKRFEDCSWRNTQCHISSQ